MTTYKFHLKVKPVVDRILLFDQGLLIGEMTELEDESTDEKIFNGCIEIEENPDANTLETLDIPETSDADISETPQKRELDAVFLCYCLGNSTIEASAVFSLPFQTQPADITGDFAPNTICVNYYLPKIDNDYESDGVVANGEIATAKCCIIDIPDRLQTGLGLPSLIILPSATLRGEMTADKASEFRKRGIDVKAAGFFVKQIIHLWAKSDADAAECRDAQVQISLYANSITKKIEIPNSESLKNP